MDRAFRIWDIFAIWNPLYVANIQQVPIAPQINIQLEDQASVCVKAWILGMAMLDNPNKVLVIQGQNFHTQLERLTQEQIESLLDLHFSERQSRLEKVAKEILEEKPQFSMPLKTFTSAGVIN